jgi:four helix bundle protein
LKQRVYRLSRKSEFARDLPLVSQIRRAASSVTANIVEGFERSGNREFIHFLSTSKGSAGEIRDHLYTAFDERYITESEFRDTYTTAEEVGRLIGGLMRYLERTDVRGSKFSRLPRGTSNSKPETRNAKPS